MKKIKEFLSKERLIKIINILFIISILLELNCFYNSISTLIRVIIISILFLIILIFYSNKKDIKYLLSYFLALTIYIILHLINCNNISILNEILYFYKMIMNIFIIYILYKLNYNLDNFKTPLKYSSLIISLSIIICNIFKIGYSSYNLYPVENNIFDWFIGNNFYLTSSTIGYFAFTNQISAILLMYYSFMLIILESENKWSNFFIMLSTIISMIMIGTRVSTFGPIIMSIISLISYLLISIVKKNKIKILFIIKLLILILLGVSLYFISPQSNRVNYYNEVIYNNKSNEVIINNNVSNINNNKKSFLNKLEESEIDKNFYLDYYPYKEDIKFYEYFIKLDRSERLDVRVLEREVIKRVKYLNNNELDDYLGIGYDRVINIFNIENDYIMQYYSLGLIGLFILLGVNIVILIWSYLKVLFNLRKYLTYKNVILIASVTFTLACSYFTGNILNSISTIIPISFMVGILINELKVKNNKEYEYYMGFKTTNKSKEYILNNIFDGNRYILFNINPLICYNLRKDKKIKSIINKELYNIPDGNGIVLTSKLKSESINNSIPGIEMLLSICEYSIKNNYSIYLYGTTEENISNSKKELENIYKGINIVGYSSGFGDYKEVLKDIKKCKPDILFVGLGSPKQERFIIDNNDYLNNIKVIMPVGGSFDVIGGNLSRAPKWIRKIKMEWLYRMIKEPKRFKDLFKIIAFIFVALFSDICYNEDGGNE